MTQSHIASGSPGTLRAGVAALAGLITIACILVAVAARGLFVQGLSNQIASAQSSVAEVCDELKVLYEKSGSRKGSGLNRDVANVVLKLILEHRPGVEGGIWSAVDGFVAYAYPTYETGEKVDTPVAEQPRIAALAQRAIDAGTAQSENRKGEREVNILVACPLTAGDAAWVMTRISANNARMNDRWALALAGLAGLILAGGGWQISRLRRWSQSLTRVADAILQAENKLGARIEVTGHPDLDLVCHAFNRNREELQTVLDRERLLTADLRQAERSALVGGMVASLAHEIRNPLGAMRLKAENALAGSPDRVIPALQSVLTQTDRLEGLLSRLLALSRPLHPRFTDVEIQPWLDELAAVRREQAAGAGVTIKTKTTIPAWRFDPELLREAADNLLQNALQHTPEGGVVSVSADRDGDNLRLTVSDSGPGIQADFVPKLFTPFESRRHGGTGLGLSIARDILIAHGGGIEATSDPYGATFAMRIPWRAS